MSGCFLSTVINFKSVSVACLTSCYFGYTAVGADVSQVECFQRKAGNSVHKCSREGLSFVVQGATAVVIVYWCAALQGYFVSSTNAGLVDHLCIIQANIIPVHFIFSFHYQKLFIAPNMYYSTCRREMLKRKVEKKIMSDLTLLPACYLRPMSH